MTTVHQNCPLCGSSSIQPLLQTTDWLVTQEEFTVAQCSACQITFTQNVPSPDLIAPYYETNEYLSHNDQPTTLFGRVYHAVKKINTALKIRTIENGVSSGRIFEIGAGTGDLLRSLQKRGWTVNGTEINDQARQKAESKLSTKLYSTTNGCLHVSQNSQDRVIMMHSLEHIYDIDDTLKFVKHIIKPNGNFIVAVPNFASADSRHYKEKWAALDVPRHLYHFTPETLSALLNKYGFELAHQTVMPFDAYFISILSENNKNKGLFTIIIAGIKASYFLILSLLITRNSSSLIYTFHCKRD